MGEGEGCFAVDDETQVGGDKWGDWGLGIEGVEDWEELSEEVEAWCVDGLVEGLEGAAVDGAVCLTG